MIHGNAAAPAAAVVVVVGGRADDARQKVAKRAPALRKTATPLTRIVATIAFL